MIDMVTAVGMRQRWLLGRYEAEKYPKVFDGHSTSKKVLVMSTNTARTLQNAYAEMAGALYAHNTSSRFSLT